MTRWSVPVIRVQAAERSRAQIGHGRPWPDADQGVELCGRVCSPGRRGGRLVSPLRRRASTSFLTRWKTAIHAGDGVAMLDGEFTHR